MLHRVVKMTFHPEKVDTFLEFFESNKSTIKAFEGCHQVRLMRDEQFDNIFFTYSIWEDASYLAAYRHSGFFSETWKFVKTLFAHKAEAWSLRETT